MSPAARAAANGHAGAFDLAAAAQAAEGDVTPFRFTYAGTEYELPPQNRWRISALAKISNGLLDEALSELLGAQQYRELADAGLTVSELNALFEEASKRAGLGDLPNSPRPQQPASTQT